MALKGISVIEFAGLAPGPFCGKVLKDLGARVIRIDRAGTRFDQDRLSHGKQSISLNLKTEKGIEIVKRLTKNADVLIEPFRKGVMERLGLGPKEMFNINPHLIYARLTGYGQFGPLADKAGHDINYISYAGVLSTFGRENEKPHAPVNIVADFAGGGLMTALAIVSSLFELQTGKIKNGKVLDCSMVEGAAYLSTWLWTSRDLPGVWGTKRGSNALDGGYAPYDTYETKDGKYISCGSLEPQFYAKLLEGLGLNSEEIDVTKEILESEFKKKTQKEWEEIFDKLDACFSPVLELDEAPLYEHNRQRNSFIELNDKQMLPTMNWLPTESTNAKANIIPKLGEHTQSILSELGYSQDLINEMVNEKIIEITKVKSKI